MSTNPDGKTVVLARKYNWVEDAKVVVSDTGVTWNVIDFNYPANEQYYFTNILWNPINSNWIVVGAHWFFNGGWSYGNLGLQTTTPQAPTSYNKIAALSDNTLNPNMASSLIATNNSVLTVLASDGYIFYSSNGIIGLSIKLLLD